jgi:septum formation protein
MRLPTVILASASPRRAELLRQLGVEFQVMPSSASELLHEHLSPRELCQLNAYRKVHPLAKRFPDRLVLGADTLVCLEAALFGKPADPCAAEAMLMQLQGQTHHVVTGVCLRHWRAHKQTVFAATTTVTFRPLSLEQIREYLRLVHPLDKAGAYAIQEHGDRIVERVEGSFSNVVGLPLERLEIALKEFEKP